MQVFVRPQKRLLRQVFGIGGKTPAPQKVQHRGLKSPQQLIETIRCTPAVLGRQALRRWSAFQAESDGISGYFPL